MKDYNNIPFKNAAIDRLTSRTTPPPAPVNLRANAENRMAASIRKSGNYNTTKPNVNDQNTKIASLNDPQNKVYVSMTESKRQLPNTLASGSWNNFLNDSEKNTSATSYDKINRNFNVSQQKLKTLAPSYVDPTGPSTLQGVKTTKKKAKKS